MVDEAIAPLLDTAHVSGGSRILDVGTGPGLVAAAVRERGGDVVGIDFSEAMLEEAGHPWDDADGVKNKLLLVEVGRP